MSLEQYLKEASQRDEVYSVKEKILEEKEDEYYNAFSQEIDKRYL